MSRAVLFAILAGVSAATWTICLKLASTKITPALGALVITSGALLVNAVVILITRASGHEIVFTREALWLMALAGTAAAGVDIFALLAYDRGLKATSSFFIGGTSTVLVLLVGFVALQEPFTWIRLLAIAMIVGGSLLLQAQGG
ncbi:MAG TPA: EamA family transporter [Methylomirabilota bacterium]|nr:EamA family transporter [Methylomirabilota bacterium]